ncbi:MAG: sigma-70 family RNA polymerase sigma factor [Clostridia bacterium]|nr:sigma-70 family RNA polymerase sigma factor [Clostridia bacterium]MBQ2940571.1 sigma-70 family RNA polymerase sigma factor [Clostridia bacterium]
MTVLERNRRVEQNIGLVHTCAKRFIGRGIEYDDLCQAGSIGLIKAVEGFDEERGLCFSTYAVPVILGEMRRLFRDGGTVKVSRSLKDLSMKANRLQAAFALEHGREPTVSELASVLEVEPEVLAEALGASLPPLSLTFAGENDDEGEEWDLPTAAPEAALVDRLALRQVLEELPERDRRLILLRYIGGKTQQNTAEELGMTQVQVSRRERVILGEMRKKLTV